MTINWTPAQLKAARIPRRKLESLIRRLERCSRDMRELDMYIYGANGSGNLMHRSRPTHIDRPGFLGKPDMESPVAYVGEGFDGGDW